MEQGDYDNQHHTIIDTLDKIDPQMLAMDTAVLAIAAYAIANADQPGPPVLATRSGRAPQKDGPGGVRRVGLRQAGKVVRAPRAGRNIDRAVPVRRSQASDRPTAILHDCPEAGTQ